MHDAFVAIVLATLAVPADLPASGSPTRVEYERHTAGWINVSEYGARGDGVADDTNAIRSAVASASRSKATIVFPPGSYRVTSTIEFGADSHFTIAGAGSGYPLGSAGVSEIITTSPIWIFKFGTSARTNHNGPTISDIGFRDASPDGVALGGIYMIRTNRARVDRVAFGDFRRGSGVRLDGGKDAVVEPLFVGVQLRNCLIGIEQVGVVTAMTSLGGSFVGARLANSTGMRLNESASIVATAFDSWATAIKIRGDSNFIRARFEGNSTHINIISGKRNVITGSIFGRAEVGVHLNDSASQFGSIIADNTYASVATPIRDESGGALPRTIFEPQIGEMWIRNGVAGKGNVLNLVDTRTGSGEGAWFRPQTRGGGVIGEFGVSADGTNVGAFVGTETAHDTFFVVNRSIVAMLRQSAEMKADDTALMLIRKKSGATNLVPVTQGPPDRSGAGFRGLRVPN